RLFGEVVDLDSPHLTIHFCFPRVLRVRRLAPASGPLRALLQRVPHSDHSLPLRLFPQANGEECRAWAAATLAAHPEVPRYRAAAAARSAASHSPGARVGSLG